MKGAPARVIAELGGLQPGDEIKLQRMREVCDSDPKQFDASTLDGRIVSIDDVPLEEMGEHCKKAAHLPVVAYFKNGGCGEWYISHINVAAWRRPKKTG